MRAPTDTASSAPVSPSRLATFVASFEGRLAVGALLGVSLTLALRATVPDGAPWWVAELPVIFVVVAGGVPLVVEIIRDLLRRQAGADLLAATSIVAAALMGEWLVGAIVVLMLSGGEALEEAATSRASATLDALARRSPTVAHRLRGDDLSGGTDDVAAADIEVGDRIVVLPHELCPVDGEVVGGRGSMDESYLTGEPYVVPKSVGSRVLSGAVNGEVALTVEATARAADSRYAQIVGVLEEAEQQRPHMRRLADRLGVWYTVAAFAVAILGWAVSGDPGRLLAVLVIATPCPLLIAVPVAIIGAISLAAKRGIIVRDPGMLEQVSRVRTVLFDKTGTLTYGRPTVTDVEPDPGVDADRVLALAASVEAYSRHPLATAIVEEARRRGLQPRPVSDVSERPGAGLTGRVDGHTIRITNRGGARAEDPEAAVPEPRAGMEAVVLLDGRYAATVRFRDQPRGGAADFVAHLPRRHGVARTVIVSGDRPGEVEHLARLVGIDEVHAGVSPEGKLDIVRAETAEASTLFLGDGINDAPAMTAATVGVAFGANSDVTTEAAGAVVLDSSLERLDDLLHIGERLRRIALQSAVGGIVISVVGMGLAVAGLLTPIAGVVTQELIDLASILNAARVAMVRGSMADFHGFIANEE
ncbi:MAG: heavy metal translocating P-type ATPase [Acidimicrobiia bacterium]